MIGLATGTRVWIVAGVTDLRRGFVGLSGVVQTALGRKSILRPGIHLPRETWGSHQGVVVGRRRAVLVREEVGERPIHMAASDQWNGVVDAGTTVDVAGRDRLAAAGSHAHSAAGGVRRECFQLRNFLY
jgi:hypothetical protein